MQAFKEPPEEKEQGEIKLMAREQYLQWSEYYLFQEELGEIVDIRSVTRDSSDDSDSRSVSLSQQTLAGSSRDLPSSVAGAQTEPGVERPKRKLHCKFQWENKRQVQYPEEGESLYQSWTQSRPTLVPAAHSRELLGRSMLSHVQGT